MQRGDDPGRRQARHSAEIPASQESTSQPVGFPIQQYVGHPRMPLGGQIAMPGTPQSPGYIHGSPQGMLVSGMGMLPQPQRPVYPTSPSVMVPRFVTQSQAAVVNALQRQYSNPGPGSPVFQGYHSPSSSGHGSVMYQELQRPPAYPGSVMHPMGFVTSPTVNMNPQSNNQFALQRRLSAEQHSNTIPSSHVVTSSVNTNQNLSSNQNQHIDKPPARKRLKVDSTSLMDVETISGNVLEEKSKQLTTLQESYIEHLIEFFFLQNSGNLMDFVLWKKKPTPQLIDFLKICKLDEEDKKVLMQKLKKASESRPSTPTISVAIPSAVSAINQRVAQIKKEPGVPGLSTMVQPPPYSEHMLQQASAAGGLSTTITDSSSGITSHGQTVSVKSPMSPTHLQTQRHILTSVIASDTIGSQEAIVERAKQEAQVLQRITELRKVGMWSSKRLPKVQEPPRHKAHWDYLLEEMHWLAADFAQERKWKRAACRKTANMVVKYHKEKEQKFQRAEKEEGMRLKRVASSMAKQIKEFWANIEKVVQYKQTSRLEEKRKRALDLHLNFIVDQTEKYSTWLTEGLSKPGSTVSDSLSLNTTPIASDEEFEPDPDDTDDEETIEKEEKVVDVEGQRAEIEALQKESEMPIEDLLKSLPREALQETHNTDEHESGDEDEVFSDDTDTEEDEETLLEQEQQEVKIDHNQELKDLENEGEMSVEDLYKKYAGAYADDFKVPTTDDEESEEEMSEGEETEEETEEEEEGTDDEKEVVKEIGMEYLLHPESEESETPLVPRGQGQGQEGPALEITDIAATAQSLQPTGYTLETTKVKVPIPFLIKHELREYQYVGLDWLATMYDKKLNGILADEMGLGKTIQTIALLAHLACEHGVWGPHLIVVPTSVMLNWEMEFKKWSPAFKILTYYGTQKERKQKRTGWTKTNAFHVCITSYKLVIQDHQSFRRKKWKYFILDEAQNIKNFKSQRWQTLLNFQSMRRLLLTGTPLQNNLMELWSLMHFLMPHVFQSHREFKEWFSNPLTGMVEGSQEYNENLIKRLHKVLRPFLLRRLKADVEKQMPKKYEHVVMCHLSKRQRFLYDDFMSKRQTKETLASGHFMSVINILMQLRKVCNHPNLFDPRPIVSPFQMEGIQYTTASLLRKALEFDPMESIALQMLHPGLATLERDLTAYAGHRVRSLQVPRKLIEEIDSVPDPPPRPRPVKLKFRTASSQVQQQATGRSSPFVPIQQRATSPMLIRSPLVRSPLTSQPQTASQVLSQIRAGGMSPVIIPSSINTTQVESLPGYTGSPKSSTPSQGIVYTAALSSSTSSPITVQIHQTAAGTRLLIPSGQLSQLPAGLIQIVQTSSGQQILAKSSQIAALQQAAMRHPVSTATSAVQTNSVGTANTSQTPLHPHTPSGSSPTTLLNGPSSLTTTSTSTPLTSTVSSASNSIPGINSSILQAISSTRSTTTTTTPSASALLQNIIVPKTTTATMLVVTPSAVTSNRLVSTASTTNTLSTGRSIPIASTASVVTPVLRTTVASSASILTKATTNATLVTPNTSGRSIPTSSVGSFIIPTGRITPIGSKVLSALPGSRTAVVTLPTSAISNKPIIRVSPLVTSSSGQSGTTALKTLNTVMKPSVTTQFASTKSVISTQKPEKLTVAEKKMKSELRSENLIEKKKKWRADTLDRIARINKHRCNLKPVYGQDLCQAVNIMHDLKLTHHARNVQGSGFVNIYNVHHHPRPVDPIAFWNQTKALARLVHRPQDYMAELSELLEKYVFVTPPVISTGVTMHTSHPPPSLLQAESVRRHALQTELSPRVACLHTVTTNMTVQFPEVRLIQYDCGKLQTLDVLLRQLKAGDHRSLIFTQMTKMLDVLEAFLNYYGYRYLRLDGTTKVEQRQLLMDRFNADKRIFAFILSTRSGGIGVNLTGADTVIFYDSDWNPTMDAQAQDRCHRIGQTRDVHIYRLISENTVEENILKKANQKRLLGDVAIEGGNFTTAFFKQSTISELFEKPSGLQDLAEEKAAREKQKEAERVAVSPHISSSQLEQALCGAEDETDVQAAKVAVAEQNAELDEFDETVPWDEKEGEGRKPDEVTKVEMELAQLQSELLPIERYAVAFMESVIVPFNSEELKLAEEQVEIAKQDWELGRLKAIKEEEELRMEIEEDDMLYTYSHEDSQNQVKNKKSSKNKPTKTKTRVSPRKNKSNDEEWVPDEKVPNQKHSPQKCVIVKSIKPQRFRVNSASKAYTVDLNTSIRSTKSDPGGVMKEGALVKALRSKGVRSEISIVIPKLDGDKMRHVVSKRLPSPVKSTPISANKKITSFRISPGSSLNRRKSSTTTSTPRSNIKSPPVNTPQPWSRTDLVIRTRKAVANEAKLRHDSDCSDVDIETVSNDSVATPSVKAPKKLDTDKNIFEIMQSQFSPNSHDSSQEASTDEY